VARQDFFVSDWKHASSRGTSQNGVALEPQMPALSQPVIFRKLVIFKSHIIEMTTDVNISPPAPQSTTDPELYSPGSTNSQVPTWNKIKHLRCTRDQDALMRHSQWVFANDHKAQR
jgi:hypothetical protein